MKNESDWSEDRLEPPAAVSPGAADPSDSPADAGGDSAAPSDSGDPPAPAADVTVVAARPPRESSVSPLPMTPPSSCVSPSPELSVSSAGKSSGSARSGGGDSESPAQSACSSSQSQDGGDSEVTPNIKSPVKPPKYTILAPHVSQMYMTPSYVPHYHIWAPYYTLQTSVGAPPNRPPAKACPRHGHAQPPPPPPPMSLPPPPVSAAGPRGPPSGCWLHQTGPPPPLPMPLAPFPPCSPALPHTPSNNNQPFSVAAPAQLQRARYASPCKQPMGRGGYICGPRLTTGGGRCAVKQPDLGGAGDAPPPRGEMAPITPPPTPGRGDQPVKVETAATRLQTMTL